MPNTPPPRHFDLPPEVAVEIAGYLRSSLFAPLSSNITRLRDECNVSMSAQKDSLQDVCDTSLSLSRLEMVVVDGRDLSKKLITMSEFQVQSQISNVIEPAAAQLIPIATELNSVYQQIDLLEGLILRVNENIRQMTSKVERTELALRREERALSDGKPPPMWKGYEKVKVFQAKDYVENGRLKETAAL